MKELNRLGIPNEVCMNGVNRDKFEYQILKTFGIYDFGHYFGFCAAAIPYEIGTLFVLRIFRASTCCLNHWQGLE